MTKHFLMVVFLVAFTSILMRLWIENSAITARKVGLPV